MVAISQSGETADTLAVLRYFPLVIIAEFIVISIKTVLTATTTP